MTSLGDERAESDAEVLNKLIEEIKSLKSKIKELEQKVKEQGEEKKIIDICKKSGKLAYKCIYNSCGWRVTISEWKRDYIQGSYQYRYICIISTDQWKTKAEAISKALAELKENQI